VRGKGAPWDAVLNPWHNQEEFGGILLGHPMYLKAKAGGDKSLWEKQGTREGGYRVAVQDPYERVKAGLPEPQSPGVEPHPHGLQRL